MSTSGGLDEEVSAGALERSAPAGPHSGAPAVDSNSAPRKARKLRKPNDMARCQVDGCGQDLSEAKLYLRRYSVCDGHFKADHVTITGSDFRFCQQCNKFQPLEQFISNRRSCKTRSEDRNLRRRKQRTDERQQGATAELPPDQRDQYAERVPAAVGAARGRITAEGIAIGSVALNDTSLLRQMTDDGSFQQQQQQQQVQQQQVQQLLLAATNFGQQQQQQQAGEIIMGAQAFNQHAALQLLGVPPATVVAPPPRQSTQGGDDPNNMHHQQQQQHHQMLLAQLLKASTGGSGGGAPMGGMVNPHQVHNNSAVNTLAQQFLLQQAGSGGGGYAGTGMDLSGLQVQDLGSLLQLQQNGQPNNHPAPPVLLLHNQNVMVLSLDQLGMLGNAVNAAQPTSSGGKM